MFISFLIWPLPPHPLHLLLCLSIVFHVSFVHIDICIHSLAWLISPLHFCFCSWLSFLCANYIRILLILVPCYACSWPTRDELKKVAFEWCAYSAGFVKRLEEKLSYLIKEKKRVNSLTLVFFLSTCLHLPYFIRKGLKWRICQKVSKWEKFFYFSRKKKQEENLFI